MTKKNKTIYIPRRYSPPEGKTTIFIDNDTEYCIIKKEGKLYAINNLCPHQGASLGLGNIEKDEIICPLHLYKFNIKTGKCNIKDYDICTYSVAIID